MTLSFQSFLSRNDEFFKFFFQISTNLSKFKPSLFVSYSIFLCKSPFFFKIWKKKKFAKIIVRLTRGRKKGRKKLKQTRKILKIFKFQAKISNFQGKILRISKDFIEIFQIFKFFYWNFSNFHSIFKRNFWFCKIHLKIERNWEKKNCKNLSFVWRESGKEQFWKILVNFWNFLEN